MIGGTVAATARHAHYAHAAIRNSNNNNNNNNNRSELTTAVIRDIHHGHAFLPLKKSGHAGGRYSFLSASQFSDDIPAASVLVTRETVTRETVTPEKALRQRAAR